MKSKINFLCTYLGNTNIMLKNKIDVILISMTDIVTQSPKKTQHKKASIQSAFHSKLPSPNVQISGTKTDT